MSGWRRLLPWARREDELEEEVRAHLEMATRDRIAAGQSPLEAEAAARRELGNELLVREVTKDTWGWAPLERVIQDLRSGLRIRRRPFLATTVIASLALGVGANSAVFSLFAQFLWRSLPVPEATRLVNLRSPGHRSGAISSNRTGSSDAVFSYPLYRDIERLASPDVLVSVAAHRSLPLSAGYRGEAGLAQGLLVSGSYFPTLRLQPALGRLLGPGDDRAPGAHPVAVLSYDYWRSRFGGRLSAPGETLTLNGEPFEIVGVAPEGFAGTTLGTRADLFVPVLMRGALTTSHTAGFADRMDHWVYLFARLAPHVSRAEAETALEAPFRPVMREVEAPLQTGLSERDRAEFAARPLLLEDGSRGQSRDLARMATLLGVVLVVTSLVLLIACANVANLLLAQGVGRADEMAVRASLGASPSRLLRQLLAEALLLAGLGGLAGLLVARWTLEVLAILLDAAGTSLVDAHLEPPASVFAVLLALSTGLIAALFPALETRRPRATAVLQGGAPRAGERRGARRFRTTVATAQVALSMALLGPAVLLARSLANVANVDLGLHSEGVATFGLSPERGGYTPEESQQALERTVDELRALPGVQAVALAQVGQLQGWHLTSNVSVEGFEERPGTDAFAHRAPIGDGFFRTLGIPLLAGREFERADLAEARRVAIVNEAFARKFGLGRDAVGRSMSLGSGGELDLEIVGVAANARHNHPKEAPAPTFFLPMGREDSGAAHVYVRTAAGAAQFFEPISATVTRVAPDLPTQGLRTLEDQVRESTRADRAVAGLASAFAVLATVLACIGLYGVLAYDVARRTREIGVRMALGADAGRVCRLVLSQIGRIGLVGGLLGVMLATAAGRLSESFLFGIDGGDPTSLVTAALLLGSVAFLAGYLPARRASRVDPADALRAQ